ncbi:hypothetical protein PybrP1_009170 [[Pythium] brassicae (nom. inval.)]|nr:hypothetical protein PybrP1_009170 [[Pythium] brassicae (nom. inval.)]
MLCQLPLSLLKTAQGHPMVRSSALTDRMERAATPLTAATYGGTNLCAGCVCAQLVELKNGDTYNGHLVNCDTWMNVNLRDVICTSKVRGRWGPCRRHSHATRTTTQRVLTHAVCTRGLRAGWRPLLEDARVLYPRQHDQVHSRPERRTLALLSLSELWLEVPCQCGALGV